MISLNLTRLHVALLLYITFIIILLLIRPAIMFTHDGRLKRWGMDNDENTNMFAFGFIVPLAGIIMYIIATWLDFVMYKP